MIFCTFHIDIFSHGNGFVIMPCDITGICVFSDMCGGGDLILISGNLVKGD